LKKAVIMNCWPTMVCMPHYGKSKLASRRVGNS
jgi:hypothetical protein